MVVLLILQWLTAEQLDDSMTWHARFGYVFIGVVLFRISWGLLGTHYARFSQFVSGPKTIIDYIKRSKNGTAPTYTGHNPLGGWMVLVLLTLLLVQGISGLFMTDDIFFNGPYYSAVNADIQSIMAKIHNTAFITIQIAVALHILAVLIYVYIKKQALIGAMITGRKRTNARSIITNYWLRACLIALMIAALTYLAIEVWAPEPVDDWY
jgi:cytochrome b